MGVVLARMLSNLLAGAAVLAAEVSIPIGGGAHGVEGLRIVPVGGVQARVEYAPVEGGQVARVVFRKNDDVRRLLALVAQCSRDLTGVRTARVTYRLRLTRGRPPRAMVAAFERGGAMWFRVLSEPMVVGEQAVAVIPLTSLKLASFTEDASSRLEWNAVSRVWIGMVIDGPAEGTLELLDARLSSEPFRASRPLAVMGEDGGRWGAAHDPRAVCKVTTPAEGPQGRRCMKMEFVFPLGKHMYAVPSIRIPPGELEGYSGVRFKYKAILPRGIRGVLVTVGEADGSQYEAYPYPPASEAWREVTIPFSKFRLAGWTRDENGKLDRGQLRTITIGAHGTARGDGGKGTIWVADLCLVP